MAATAATSRVSRKRAAEDGPTSLPQPAKRVRKQAEQAQTPPASSTPTTLAQQATDPINEAPQTRLNVYVFGEGSAGELGLGSKGGVDVKRPRLNAKLDAATIGVVNIATGGMHAVALTHDNKILTWGVNDNYALGRDTAWSGGLKDIDAGDDDDASDDSEVELNPLESTPTAIPAQTLPSNAKFVQVSAGDSATFALTDYGQVYGWGSFVNNEGKGGFATASGVLEKQQQPTLIPGLARIVQISTGNNFCLALDKDGKVHSWGRSEQNQLGRRPAAARHRRLEQTAVRSDKEHLNDNGLLPGLVALPPRCTIVSIHAGSDHAFAVDSKGDTWAWGLNNFGQTGIAAGAGKGGSTVVAPKLVQSLRRKGMKVIKGGSHHSIGLAQDGQCLVWGRLDGAQMGLDLATLPLEDPKRVIQQDGKPRILLEPAALKLPIGIYVAAGSDHNLLVTDTGKAFSWGFNSNYQCGQGPNTDDISIATLIDNTAVREQHLCWAGAGGQYSMLASPYSAALVNGNHASS